MPDGPILGGVVLFVRDLDRSSAFYQGLLGLEETLRESEAALLESNSGSHVYLRTMPQAVRASASVGIQYAIWAVDARDQFSRAERWLLDRDALIARHEYEGRIAVEGRDPDDLPVMVGYPSWRDVHPTEIFGRIFHF